MTMWPEAAKGCRPLNQFLHVFDECSLGCTSRLHKANFKFQQNIIHWFYDFHVDKKENLPENFLINRADMSINSRLFTKLRPLSVYDLKYADSSPVKLKEFYANGSGTKLFLFSA